MIILIHVDLSEQNVYFPLFFMFSQGCRSIISRECIDLLAFSLIASNAKGHVRYNHQSGKTKDCVRIFEINMIFDIKHLALQNKSQ